MIILVKIEAINAISVSIFKKIVINLSFVVQSLLGGIILGIYPALAALFEVIDVEKKQKLTIDETLKIQWSFFKRKGIQINKLLLKNYVLLFGLYYSIKIVEWNNLEIFQNLKIINSFLFILIGVINIYSVFSFQKYQLTGKDCFKNSYFMLFFSPWAAFKVVLILFLVGYLCQRVSLVFLFFGMYLGGNLIYYQLLKIMNKVTRISQISNLENKKYD